MTANFKFKILTQGKNDVIGLDEKIFNLVKKSEIQDGFVLIFCPASTAGITTIEAEPNLIEDFKEFLEKLVPSGKDYHHDKTWGEKNAPSHIRSALIKPFLIVPIQKSRLLLGQWQNIVLVDFDNRPREREIIVTIMG